MPKDQEGKQGCKAEIKSPGKITFEITEEGVALLLDAMLLDKDTFIEKHGEPRTLDLLEFLTTVKSRFQSMRDEAVNEKEKLNEKLEIERALRERMLFTLQ